MFNKYSKLFIISGLLIVFFIACKSATKVRYIKRTIPKNVGLAVIIDSPNDLKNVVYAKFLSKGYSVKAINASDFYLLDDIFDIKDFKKISYSSGIEDSLLSLEKTYNNIYKLHIYNFEINKAEILSEMSSKWNVQYLIILDLKNWEGLSWGRAIDLRSKEIIWLENYSTAYTDTIETVVEHFIKSMTSK